MMDRPTEADIAFAKLDDNGRMRKLRWPAEWVRWLLAKLPEDLNENENCRTTTPVGEN